MPSLLSRIFGDKQQQAQQQQQQTTQQPQVQQPVVQAQPNTNQNALDILTLLGQNNVNGNTPQAPRYNIPQEELSKVTQGLSFTRNLPQEMLQRLQSGDVTALPEILDAFGRNLYQTTMTHNMGLTDKFVEDRFGFERQGLEGLVRENSTVRSLDQQLAHVHPYARGMLQDLAVKIRREYPNASEQDIMDTVTDVMSNMSKTFSQTPEAVAQQQRQQAAEPNWDSFGDFDTSGDSTTQSQSQATPGTSAPGVV